MEGFSQGFLEDRQVHLKIKEESKNGDYYFKFLATFSLNVKKILPNFIIFCMFFQIFINLSVIEILYKMFIF